MKKFYFFVNELFVPVNVELQLEHKYEPEV
jgi:hypothetical protein